MTVLIRTEEPADQAFIHQVHLASFPSAVEARLVDELRAAGRLTLSLVALVNGQLVGHIGFSPVTAPGPAAGLGLAPVAVIPPLQGRGIGSALINEGLELCRRAGFGFVVLVGEPDYYSRFGFAPARGWGLEDQYQAGDAFQALELRPNVIPRDGGLVRYSPEFESSGSEAGS
jgi:putative acetyltransferase